MPDLAQYVIADLRDRLEAYLGKKDGYSNIEYLDSGGSAAIFKVGTPAGLRAYKVFDPRFLKGPGGEAEKQRLDVQRRLIGHECPGLVQIYQIDEAEGTAISEMEFIPWPQLKKRLSEVPDDKIENLIRQLIDVVKFLESKDIVHRDIKPENIHVSADFESLKLLDLGVARVFEIGALDAGVTDQNNTRPFVATAQYSSPEYLFRLDEPSPTLWKGLNIYQVGAVLHDLIQKEALFQFEMDLGNRWLVSKAVLTKTPTFKDLNPQRLPRLKSLSLKCLNKDLETRLRLVDWSDFTPETEISPVEKLKEILNKNTLLFSEDSEDMKLEFDRNEFFRRFKERIRDEILGLCSSRIPLDLQEHGHSCFECRFTCKNKLNLRVILYAKWLEGLYKRSAEFYISAFISSDEIKDFDKEDYKLFFTSSIDAGDDILVTEGLQHIAAVLTKTLELIELTDNPLKLVDEKIII